MKCMCISLLKHKQLYQFAHRKRKYNLQMLVYGKVPLQMPKKTAQMHMERGATTTTKTKTPRQLAHTHKKSESSAIAWIEQAKIKVYISMEHIFHCLLHSHFICTRCTTLYDCSFFFARSIFSKSTISYHWGLWMCAWNIFNGKCKAACMDIW